MLSAKLILATLLMASSSESFDYYIKEYETHYLEDKDPMAKLIDHRLAESIFEATSQAEFQSRIQKIRDLYRERPDRAKLFKRLDAYLRTSFEERLKRSKQRRWLYAAGGAVVGALVSIPIAKSLGDKASLWIAIPAGALVGGGSGFLLGNLIETPKYQYSSALVTSDIDDSLKQIEDLMK